MTELKKYSTDELKFELLLREESEAYQKLDRIRTLMKELDARIARVKEKENAD